MRCFPVKFDTLVRVPFILATVLLLLSPHDSRAAGKRLDEYEVKAAYLYNFAKYVDWPVTSLPSEATMTYCIVGSGPMNSPVHSLEGKLARNRRVTVRDLNQSDDLNGCHLLFINGAQKGQLPRILTSAAGRSVLTVSDDRGFATSGGMIEFVPVGDKIKFQINHRSARQANLKISSRLLNLATTVIE